MRYCRIGSLAASLAIALAVSACAKKAEPSVAEDKATPHPQAGKPSADEERAEALRKKGFKIEDLGERYVVRIPQELFNASNLELLRGFTSKMQLFVVGGYGYGENPSITDDSIQSIPPLDGLEELELGKCPNVTDAGLTHLDRFPNLRDFSISGRKVTDVTAKELAKLTNLKGLFLVETNLSNAGLATISGMKSLEVLKVGATVLSDAGLKSINALRDLNVLDLSELPLTDAGIAQLDLPALRHLAISATKVSDAGLGNLSKLPSLTSLALVNCQVTDKGILALKSCPKLKHVYGFGSKVTKAGADALMKAKPGLEVVLGTD